jgi:hypothetical protein
MRVSYRSCRSCRVTAHEQTGILAFCCQEMRDEWGVLIGFGIKGHHRTTSRDVSTFSRYVFSTGTVIPVIAPIRFCPWCGEGIEVVRTK